MYLSIFLVNPASIYLKKKKNVKRLKQFGKIKHIQITHLKKYNCSSVKVFNHYE